ncbi:MAG: DUF1761 domain-containing protein [Hyphomicrobiaceae bacterium]
MELFSGLNLWGVLLAAALSFVFGGVWYGTMSKAWMDAAGLDEERVKGRNGPSPAPFVITFVAQIVMAWFLAGALLHLARAGVPASVRTGMIAAFSIWLGFIATTLVVNHQFQMQRTMLTLIDGGHWLGVMLIQGAVLGWIGLT